MEKKTKELHEIWIFFNEFKCFSIGSTESYLMENFVFIFVIENIL